MASSLWVRPRFSAYCAGTESRSGSWAQNNRMWVSQMVGIATPGGISQLWPQWRHHIRQGYPALQLLEPLAGGLGGIVFSLQPDDHTAAGVTWMTSPSCTRFR
jgi:hypothetical protein